MILPESGRHDLAVPLERFAGAIAHFGRVLGVGHASGRRCIRSHSRNTPESGDADRNGSDDRKHHLPALGRHGVLHDAMGCMKASNRSRSDVSRRDEKSRPDRPHSAEDLNTLEDRVRDAVTSARSQITFAQQYCAWTRV
jgi:hypothetical protein